MITKAQGVSRQFGLQLFPCRMKTGGLFRKSAVKKPKKMKKVLGIVQARVGSTRLPRKVLLPLNGKPAIVQIMNRMLACQDLETVYLAIPDSEENDILARLAEENGWDFFRGSEDDVLSRFSGIASIETPDIIARINADNFAICPEVVSHGIRFLIEGEFDVCTPFINNTYPFGVGAEVSTAECLERIVVEAQGNDSKYREHIYFYAYDHPNGFHIGLLNAPDRLRRPDIDISVDTEDDYRVLQHLYAHFIGQETHFTLMELIEIWDSFGLDKKHHLVQG
jgi:spore coat polysaccharide biosynthesis protein SpsF